MRTLDQFVQYAGTAAFGRNAVVFVWIAMAYATLVTILFSFATITMYYDPIDVATLIKLDDARRDETVTTPIRDELLVAPSKERRFLPLDSYVHYLGDKSFYAPSEMSDRVKYLT